MKHGSGGMAALDSENIIFFLNGNPSNLINPIDVDFVEHLKIV